MKDKRLAGTIYRFLLCVALLGMVSGCSSQQETVKETKALQKTEQPDAEETETNAEETEIRNTEIHNTEIQNTEVQHELLLYITLGNGEFQTYPYTGEGGEGIPAGMIQGIADITGWDLTLADDVYSGRGGISVIFSSESSIFTGPPENQAEEFHVYDSEQMTYAILDSIQKTLQNYASTVNPDSVDIWYAMEDGQPLTIGPLGVTLPIDQPYSHKGLSELLKNSTNQ